jgi:putative transposase
MSETLDPVAMELDQRQLAEQLLAQAKEQGVELVGPNGLLNQLTKNVLETALDAEMAEHLGYDKHDPAGRGSGNSRNGTRAKTVLTEIGPVEIEVPRDTNSSFEPQIVKKRQRRLTGIDEIVLSLTAKGLTTGEVAAHFADVYGATVSKDTISRITDKVIGEMAEWCNRPLEPRGVSGGVHRCDLRQDPRRSGRQPTHLRRGRRHLCRGARHPRVVGRRWRGGISSGTSTGSFPSIRAAA